MSRLLSRENLALTAAGISTGSESFIESSRRGPKMFRFQPANVVHGQRLRALAIVVVALALGSVLFSQSAAAAISTSFSLVPASTAAASHPDLTAGFALPGSPDVKSLTITLPQGLHIAPAAVTSPCPLSNAAAGTCPASSQIGTVSATALSSLTASGAIYLTAPPTVSDAAGIAIAMTVSGGLGTFVSQASLSLNNIGVPQPNQQISFGNFGNTTLSSGAVHFTQLSFTFTGTTGAPAHPLVTNPSTCPTTAFNAVGAVTATDGSAATSPTPYPTSACTSVPFGATFDDSFSTPVAYGSTNAAFTWDYPSGSSSPKAYAVKLPLAVQLNYAFFGNVSPTAGDECPTSSISPSLSSPSRVFDPSGCPAQSKVGTATISTPLTAAPLAATVYAVSEQNFPAFGISASQNGVTIRMIATLTTPYVSTICDSSGNTTYPSCPDPLPSNYCDVSSGACQQTFQLTIPSAPEIPVTELQISFGAFNRIGISGQGLPSYMFSLAGPGDPKCSFTNLTMTASPYTASPGSVAYNDPFSLYGCGGTNPPSTTVTPTSFVGALSGSATPTFSLVSNDPAATFQCKVDTRAYVACSSPYTVTPALSDGQHTLKVRAVNAAGVDPNPPATTFTVDTTAPAPPPITSPTEGQSVNANPLTATFSGEAGGTFKCKVDTASYAACASPFQLPTLANGQHSLAVTQTDAAGNTSVPSVRNFTMATFFANTFTLVPSTNAAIAHPNLTASFTLPGSPDTKSLTITMPKGLHVAPAAVSSPCPLASAAAGTCPGSSQIGTITATALGSISATGNIYMTAPPTANDATGIAIAMTVSGGQGSYIAQGSLSLNNIGAAQAIQQIAFSNLANVTSTNVAIHFTQLSFAFTGATGGPSYPLITNPSTCPATPLLATGSATATDGSATSATYSYPTTGCASVPYSATLDEVFSNPNAGQNTNATFTADLPANAASPERFIFILPAAVAINSGSESLADECPYSSVTPSFSSPSSDRAFDPTSCPAQAKIGTVSLTTPMLSAPLTGTLYWVPAAGDLYSGIGISAQQGGVTIRTVGTVGWPYVNTLCDSSGNTGYPSCPDPLPSSYCDMAGGPCPQQLALSFAKLPELPIREFKIMFDGAGRTNSSGFPIESNIFRFEAPSSPKCVTSNVTLMTRPYTLTAIQTVFDPLALLGCGAGDPPSTNLNPSFTSPTNSTAPQFYFWSGDASATFQCKVDAASYQACALTNNRYTVSPALADGAHTFKVRAVNSVGPDPRPQSFSFTVDTTGPAPPTIGSPTEGQTITSNPVNISFSGAESGGTFKCKVDSGAYSTCTSPFVPATLANGAHSVSITQTDAAGNMSAAAVRNFTVNAAFTNTFSLNPSTTAATAHPDLTAGFVLSGSPDVKSLTLTLPQGLNIAPGAVATPCPLANAANGTCAASSQIGTANAAALGGVSGVGAIYLTAPPTGGDAAGVSVDLGISGGLGSFIVQGSLSLNNVGVPQINQQLVFANMANTTLTGASIHFTQLTLSLTGTTGAPSNPLVTNPSTCPSTAQIATGTAVATDNSSATSVVSYPTTGCSGISISPTVSGSLTNPVMNQATNGTFTADFAAGGSAPSRIWYSIPAWIGFNDAALGNGAPDQCPSTSISGGNLGGASSAFDPSSCPPQAKLGTVSLTTPLLRAPLTGALYEINSASTGGYPDFGISLQQNGVAIRIEVRSSISFVQTVCDSSGGFGYPSCPNPLPSNYCDIVGGFCQQQFVFNALNLPHFPISEMSLIFGAPGRVSYNGAALPAQVLHLSATGDGTSCAQNPLKVTAMPYTNTSALATATQTMTASGC